MTGLQKELSPARKRWQKFLKHKRGLWSLRILVVIYIISLCAEIVCNSDPLVLFCRGQVFFPAFKFYTQDAVLGNGVHTVMTDYATSNDLKNLNAHALYALFRHGPQETRMESDFDKFRRVTIRIRPIQRVMRIDVDSTGIIKWAEGDVRHFFKNNEFASNLNGLRLADYWNIPSDILSKNIDTIVEMKIDSTDTPGLSATIRRGPGFASATAGTARILFRSSFVSAGYNDSTTASGIQNMISGWSRISTLDRDRITDAAQRSFTEYIPPFKITIDDTDADVTIAAEDVAWPFRPVSGNWLGTDMSGRDVFARLLYGTRIAMSFGLFLVVFSSLIGTAAGAIQGYFAGWTDLVGQRFTEIWSAIPFLYIMILLGNTLGRGFILFILCYAAFNWIGVSSYIRAEFLKLRVRAFVDAARTQGLSPARIMLRHILPNAMSPLITILPFMLVGAIGSLAALDYLGFGLPDGTPSWGALLFQAQMARHAWWLILYPSMILFTVMILGVFIGEGMREAFDPREYSKLE